MAVTNDKEFRDWLEKQSRETCVAIAFRAAMRVLPLAMLLNRSKSEDRVAFVAIRCVLTSGVAAVRPTPDVRGAAAAAAAAAANFVLSVAYARFAARSAATNSAAAANSAADAVRSAAAAVNDAAQAAANAAADDLSSAAVIPADAADAVISAAKAAANRASDALRYAADVPAKAAAYADTERAIGSLAQAANPVPSEFGEANARYLANGSSALTLGGPWTFWAKWYARAMAGDPLPWDLQEAVALIPEDIWGAGPEAVAAEIARIELGFSTEVLPRLVRNDGEDVFEVEQDELPPQEVAEFICTRIEIAYRVALEGAGANGFDEASPEAIEIALTLAATKKSNSVLAAGFWAACLSLNERIGDIYPEDTSLINLKNSLWGAVEELCELDPVAKARCGRMAALVVAQRVTDEDRALAEGAPEMVAELVSKEALAIIESDVERILTEATPPKSVRARFTNWMTTISIWMDRGMKADKKARWLADLVDRLFDWWGGPPQ